MLKVLPIQSKEEQELATAKCNVKYREDALAYLATEESPVYVTAATPLSVLWLSIAAVRRASAGGDAFALTLTERFAALLATRALVQNDRIQILSKAISVNGSL